MNLNFVGEFWSWGLKLLWSWGLELKFQVEDFGWSLKLKLVNYVFKWSSKSKLVCVLWFDIFNMKTYSSGRKIKFTLFLFYIQVFNNVSISLFALLTFLAISSILVGVTTWPDRHFCHGSQAYTLYVGTTIMTPDQLTKQSFKRGKYIYQNTKTPFRTDQEPKCISMGQHNFSSIEYPTTNQGFSDIQIRTTL